MKEFIYMKKYLFFIFFVLLFPLIFLFFPKLRLNTLYFLGISTKSYCEFEIRDIKAFDFEKGKIQKYKNEITNFEDGGRKFDNSSISNNLFLKLKEAGVERGTFEEDVIERLNSNIESLKSNRRIYYEAYIINTSQYSQKLKAILGKTISKDGVVLAEGYKENVVTLSPGESKKIKFQIDYNDKDIIENYIEQDLNNYSLQLYPWFETCVY